MDDAPSVGAEVSSGVSRAWLRVLSGSWLATAAAGILIVVALAAVLADSVAPYSRDAIEIGLRNKPPDFVNPVTGDRYLLGTDPLGRDILTRLIYGARISLAAGAASVIVSGAIGVIAGLAAGFYRGRLDEITMRLVDLQMSLPSLLVALFVLYIFGPSFLNMVLVLALTRWMLYARVVRGMVLSLREQPFTEAARSLGASDSRIMLRHLLPNIMPAIVVVATLELPTMILAEAALDFLGLGIQPPETSWGLMLAHGRQYITSAWWLVTFPGLAIMLTAVCFNVVGSTLRTVTQGFRMPLRAPGLSQR
jgi:peptide/nickel transport system permease protein